jgi:hypothetical protein
MNFCAYFEKDSASQIGEITGLCSPARKYFNIACKKQVI